MAIQSKVFIAGVGLSPSKGEPDSSVVSAAVKALLDAGLTYDNVSKSIVSKDVKDGAKVLEAFNDNEIPVDSVSAKTILKSAAEAVTSGKAQCVLAVGTDKKENVAFVLVSEDFMLRWPYLKDSSMAIAKPDDGGSLASVARKVWQLRGWEQSDKADSNDSVQLSRVDGDKAPKWKDVHYKQDGKHRLGYNPATETREVSQEDFEAVRASGKGKQKDNGKHFERHGGDRAILRRQHKLMAKL